MYKDFIQKLHTLCFNAGEYDGHGFCKYDQFLLLTEYGTGFHQVPAGYKYVDWDATGFQFIFAENTIVIAYRTMKLGTCYSVDDALVYVSGMMSDICGTRIKLK